ncbi:MAG: hypothetical protein IT175_10550 [Acidobacteria bacterium]|nr:hypothetical protein [Acidobacteriota bacterium]
MIAPLRRWHRRATAALAIAVPAMLGTALFGRPEAPVNASLPSSRPATGAVSTEPVQWSRPDIAASLVRYIDETHEIAVDARTLATEPDVLAFWLESGDAGEPPMAGRLLGAVRGTGIRRFALPGGAASHGGRIALYSLGRDEVIATAAIGGAGGRP